MTTQILVTEPAVEINETETTVEVTVVEAVTTIVEVDGGPQGMAGAPGQDANASYRHTQATASSVWTVQHNLGHYPGGWYFADLDGNPIHLTVTHVNVNVALATSSEPVAGTADVS